MSEATKCDDREEPYCLGESTVFRGRGDEWFLLTWWGPTQGWSVEETLGSSMYSDDSGDCGTPLADLLAAATCEKNGQHQVCDHWLEKIEKLKKACGPGGRIGGQVPDTSGCDCNVQVLLILEGKDQ